MGVCFSAPKAVTTKQTSQCQYWDLLRGRGGGEGGAGCSLINFGGTQVPLEKRDAQEQHDWPNTRMLPFPHWQSAYKGCLFNTLKYVIIGNMLNLHKPTILVY